MNVGCFFWLCEKIPKEDPEIRSNVRSRTNRNLLMNRTPHLPWNTGHLVRSVFCSERKFSGNLAASSTYCHLITLYEFLSLRRLYIEWFIIHYSALPKWFRQNNVIFFIEITDCIKRRRCKWLSICHHCSILRYSITKL